MTKFTTVQIEGTTAIVYGLDVVKHDLGTYVGIESKNVEAIRTNFVTGQVDIAYRPAIGQREYATLELGNCGALSQVLAQDAVIATIVSPATDETSVAVALDEKQTKTQGDVETMKTTTNAKELNTTETTTKGAKTMKTVSVKSNKGKAVRTLSTQTSLAGVKFFHVNANGNLVQVSEDALVNFQQAFKNDKGETEMGFNKSLIFVGSENNSLMKMSLVSDSAYIVMNESAQSRALSGNKISEFEVMNTQAEVVTMQAYDTRNVLTVDFNNLSLETKDIMTNHVFRFGIWMRTEEASENINELTHISELKQYKPLLDTPSQKRQAKVTFLNEEKMTRMEALRGLGNHMIGYVKGQTTINGVSYYKFDVQKNATRFGLLGSSSIKLKGFTKAFGRIAKVEETKRGTVVTTTTGVRVLLCKDVEGITKQAVKVFNESVKDQAPTDKDVKPSVSTTDDFEWRVNTTDGMIISDVEFFGEMLRGQKLAGDVYRNGKRRGYAHQFRMNLQVKGLNVVLPRVKELTANEEGEGFDIILFDGARKTDMVSTMQNGIDLEYHVMLSAATFMDTAHAAISPQSMNNLNLPLELTTGIAKENFAKAEEALANPELNVEEAEELDEDGIRNVLATREFGVKKFANVNPAVWGDVYAKEEVEKEIMETMRQHQGGRLHVAGKNNYMVGDLLAILNAVADGTFLITEEQAFIARGQVAVAMARKEGEGATAELVRYFHKGQIASIRSPHVAHDETQKALAVDVFHVDYYAEALVGGFLDGLTMYSSVDMMVPASSGADFDGDTAFIIIEGRIVAAVTDSPQYVNFFAKESVEYVMEDGKIAGAYNKDGVLVKDSTVLGDACPWKSPAPAPKFDLPAGYIQDDFVILVPVEEVDTDVAYTAWMEAVHQVIKMSIMPSDIGSMSNITMALSNGINFVKTLIEKAYAEGRTQDAMTLEAELNYLENMLDVFTAIVWWSIDAAKHGGAYKEKLEAWMEWTTKDGIKAELEKDGVLNCKRVVGYVPTKKDPVTGDILKVRASIILPNALREAKFKAASIKGNMATNLQVYTEFVKAELEARKEARNELNAINHNMLNIVMPLLQGTDFPTKEAQDLFMAATIKYNEENSKLNDKKKQFIALTRSVLMQDAIDFDAMNTAKQNDIVKRMHPEFNDVRVKQAELLSHVRHLLRMEVVKRGWNVAQFAAAVYVKAYMEAMENEKVNKKSSARGNKMPVYNVWRLLEEEIMMMLSAVEGATKKFGNVQELSPAVHNITELYFEKVEGFEATYPAIAGRGFFIHKGQVWLANEAGNQPETLIGNLAGFSGFKFVPDFVYQAQARLVKVTTKGVKYEITRLFMRPMEYTNAQVVTTDVYEVPAKEAPVQERQGFHVPVTTTYTALSFPREGRFVASKVNGVMHFGLLVNGQVQLLASSTVDVPTEDGNYFVDIEFMVDGVNGPVVIVYSANRA